MSETGIEYITGRRKRRFDIVGSLALSAAGITPAAITAITTGILNREYPLLHQERMGANNTNITITKIKTLSAQLVAENPTACFGTDDPRATRLGKIARLSGIDELPQLYSVLKGDMSLVGPRCVRPSTLEKWREYDPTLFDEWYDLYQVSRPGLVGAGALERKTSDSSYEQAVAQSLRADIRYGEHASIDEDLSILSSVLPSLSGLTKRVVQRHYHRTSPR